jgi:hypothetical protein
MVETFYVGFGIDVTLGRSSEINAFIEIRQERDSQQTAQCVYSIPYVSGRTTLIRKVGS